VDLDISFSNPFVQGQIDLVTERMRQRIGNSSYDCISSLGFLYLHDEIFVQLQLVFEKREFKGSSSQPCRVGLLDEGRIDEFRSLLFFNSREVLKLL
jgi:hypothetical protein